MKLTDASTILEKLHQETDNKSQRKVYQRLMGIVSSLLERELTAKEQQSIEEAMDGLQLGGSVKTLKRSQNRFMKFLKDDHGLIPKGHYTELGVAFGLLAGTALSPLIEQAFGISAGISMGICLGMFAGLIVGQRMDRDAEKQNRVLATR